MNAYCTFVTHTSGLVITITLTLVGILSGLVYHQNHISQKDTKYLKPSMNPDFTCVTHASKNFNPSLVLPNLN